MKINKQDIHNMTNTQLIMNFHHSCDWSSRGLRKFQIENGSNIIAELSRRGLVYCEDLIEEYCNETYGSTELSREEMANTILENVKKYMKFVSKL